MPNLTSGNLKDDSLPAKKSLGDEGRPERPTQVNKYSERFERPACYRKSNERGASDQLVTVTLLTNSYVK